MILFFANVLVSAWAVVIMKRVTQEFIMEQYIKLNFVSIGILMHQPLMPN